MAFRLLGAVLNRVVLEVIEVAWAKSVLAEAGSGGRCVGRLCEVEELQLG